MLLKAAYHRHASVTPFLFQNIDCWLGIMTSIAKEPYHFVIFRGGPNPLPLPFCNRACRNVPNMKHDSHANNFPIVNDTANTRSAIIEMLVNLYSLSAEQNSY